jgi:hypothetical protein
MVARGEIPSYHKPPEKYHDLDKQHAAAIARVFEEIPHATNDPAVKASNEGLIHAAEPAGEFRRLPVSHRTTQVQIDRRCPRSDAGAV